MNLLETLRADIETIADSDLPSVGEVAKVLGALVKRIEGQARQDGLALLQGDPDPVIDPTAAVTPISPDGAPPVTAPTVPDPENPAAPALPVAATTDGGTVADHTAAAPVTDVTADVAELKSTVATLVDAVKHIFTPSAPAVTTGDAPVTDTADAVIPEPQHDIAGNPIDPSIPTTSSTAIPPAG